MSHTEVAWEHGMRDGLREREKEEGWERLREKKELVKEELVCRKRCEGERERERSGCKCV